MVGDPSGKTAERQLLDVETIEHNLQATGEREVQSLVDGEQVLEQLKQMAQVAYVRFASVYRDFKDLNEFRMEIDRLSEEPGPVDNMIDEPIDES